MGKDTVTLRTALRASQLAAVATLLSLPAAADVPHYRATTLRTLTSADARQGVAADGRHVYAIGNFRITQLDASTGTPLRRWDGVSDENGPLIHLDSGLVHGDLLYAAHSNYPRRPMTSSVEIWDAETLRHVDSHSFGTVLGSLTWLDRHDGAWWATFANYDKVQPNDRQPYGETRNTQLVRMDDGFAIRERWTFPPALLKRFAPMSNSGGSWGDDGLLYVTGHDGGEIFVVRLPEYGSELEWVATVDAPDIDGQGIAWDRSSERVLWGIHKSKRTLVEMQVPPIDALPREDPSIVRDLRAQP